MSRRGLRPRNRLDDGDRLKVHLRVLHVLGTEWRVLTFRPGFDAKFSTNHFHATWHILSDRRGARLLGRVLWSLAFQRRERTVFLIDGDHLETEPFDGANVPPILLGVDGLGTPDREAVARIRRGVKRREGSQTTVRLQTWGMKSHELWKLRHKDPRWQRERTRKIGAAVIYSAPPAVLKERAVEVAGLAPTQKYPDHIYLEGRWTGWTPEGEVQVFEDFRPRCSEARQARERVQERLGEIPERWDVLPETELLRGARLARSQPKPRPTR